LKNDKTKSGTKNKGPITITKSMLKLNLMLLKPEKDKQRRGFRASVHKLGG
jgi:hypothetical protein